MRKTEYIHFRVTQHERQQLDRLATKCGMTWSEVLRHILQSAQVQPGTVTVSPIELSGHAKAEIDGAVLVTA